MKEVSLENISSIGAGDEINLIIPIEKFFEIALELPDLRQFKDNTIRRTYRPKFNCIHVIKSIESVIVVC